jgi:hypothetical protein
MLPSMQESGALAMHATKAWNWAAQPGKLEMLWAQSDAQSGPLSPLPGQEDWMCAHARAQSSMSESPPGGVSLPPRVGSEPVGVAASPPKGSNVGVAGIPESPLVQPPAPRAKATDTHAMSSFMGA